MVDLMLDKKAEDIVVMDVRKVTSVTNHVIICTSKSTPQTKAIVDHLRLELKQLDVQPLHIEGYENLNWVLIDFVNVVIHVFMPKYREFYNLERLWGDAKITRIKDPTPDEK